MALRDRGAVPIGFTARTAAGRERARAWTGLEPSPTLAQLVAAEPRLFILTVPDDSLAAVAEELGALLAGRKSAAPPVVLHTSGVTSISVLRPCEEAGCTVLVFHPLQTFPDPTVGALRLQGSAVGITPPTGTQQEAAIAFGFALARLLEARPFVLADDRRALYHAAAVMACNYFVTLEEEARKLFVRAGLPEQEALALFLPLVTSTLENIRATGTAAALTGPVARGDADTVRKHLEALSLETPDVVPLYVALGLATVELAHRQGRLEEGKLSAVSSVLGEWRNRSRLALDNRREIGT